jgi:hypothetical protein
MRWLLAIGAIGGLVAWLHSIGALDPKLWKDTIAREREEIPKQIKEAIAAGKRAAAHAEAELEREVRESFRVDGGPRQSP